MSSSFEIRTGCGSDDSGADHGNPASIFPIQRHLTNYVSSEIVSLLCTDHRQSGRISRLEPTTVMCNHHGEQRHPSFSAPTDVEGISLVVCWGRHRRRNV